MGKKYRFKKYFYLTNWVGDKYVCEEIFNGNKHHPHINVRCWCGKFCIFFRLPVLYTLPRHWRPSGPSFFAWDNVHCQGVRIYALGVTDFFAKRSYNGPEAPSGFAAAVEKKAHYWFVLYNSGSMCDAKNNRLPGAPALTHRSFYTQTVLDTHPFTPQTFLHPDVAIHINAFTHERLYTNTFLHTDAFGQVNAYTKKITP